MRPALFSQLALHNANTHMHSSSAHFRCIIMSISQVVEWNPNKNPGSPPENDFIVSHYKALVHVLHTCCTLLTFHSVHLNLSFSSDLP